MEIYFLTVLKARSLKSSVSGSCYLKVLGENPSCLSIVSMGTRNSWYYLMCTNHCSVCWYSHMAFSPCVFVPNSLYLIRILVIEQATFLLKVINLEKTSKTEHASLLYITFYCLFLHLKSFYHLGFTIYHLVYFYRCFLQFEKSHIFLFFSITQSLYPSSSPRVCFHQNAMSHFCQAKRESLINEQIYYCSTEKYKHWYIDICA